ncbi:MAG: thioredoxin domain-containing protein [Planctomycetes bacterium]|nr:thioredoxin domain-containing protein [Planctomycetota bacterium]
MPNRLAHESSPYLLQHAHNPVDWYPWGDEALQAARALDRPIFLSIGYSACHWCHVMEHESFENEALAAQMNASFINIKVDREERPDLDQVYMQAVQMLTGRGGWPMSVFLTPELKPFYGGTYWPPTGRMGMPGFDQIIVAVTDAWRSRRDAVHEQADELTRHLAESASVERLQTSPVKADAPDATLAPDTIVGYLRGAAGALERSFDFRYGGFGSEPKFPHPVDLRVLLRCWRRFKNDGLLQMVTHTLDRMAAGGMYDQLGGGFHRYSVDARWLVPHFEKMLYDNALLLSAYTEAWQASGRDDLARVVREVADYVLRDMTDPAGGFYSTLDADSEGVEGKYYVWTPAEAEQLLGPERADSFCRVYDVSEHGNFEETNILNLPKSIADCAKLMERDPAELQAELAASRAVLLAARAKRVPPGLDDKVLVAWNGLMIDGLAQAGAALAEPRYVEAAARAAEFLWTSLRDERGRLLHTWRHGKARLAGYLDDYACLGCGLVSLYQATFDERWIERAATLADALLKHFADAEQGGFYYTADDAEALLVRQRDLYDSATPSGNGMAATLLAQLGRLLGRSDYLEACERTLRMVAPIVERAPGAAGQFLLVLDGWLGPAYELVAVGRDADTAAAAFGSLRTRFWPNKLLAARPTKSQSAALDELFAGRSAPDDVTLFVCQQSTCEAPVRGQTAIDAKLEPLSK